MIVNEAMWRDADAKARAEFDLAITSVLLDAGAGAAWRFEYADHGPGCEPLGRPSAREFASVPAGGFSADPARDPLRADAEGLARLDGAALVDAFQVRDLNPLEGLDGRARLLNRLGQTVDARPALFALHDAPRPGGLDDVLKARAASGDPPHRSFLKYCSKRWADLENCPVLDGVPLGDCWPHPQLGYTPLHKLSQWLAYSLIEPLEAAGVRTVELDGLTGLAEYRNGGGSSTRACSYQVKTPRAFRMLSDPEIVVGARLRLRSWIASRLWCASGWG